MLMTYDDEVRARMKAERQQAYEEKVTRRVKGTPETLAKQRVTMHATEMLLERGVIDGGQAANLLAIEAAWRLITEPVTPKLSSLMRCDPGERSEGDRERKLVVRYREWALDLIEQHRGLCQRVCLYVAVDSMTLAEIDERMNRRKGTAHDMLLTGLDVYHAVKRRVR